MVNYVSGIVLVVLLLPGIAGAFASRGTADRMTLFLVLTKDNVPGPTASNTVVLALPVEVMNVLAQGAAFLEQRRTA